MPDCQDQSSQLVTATGSWLNLIYVVLHVRLMFLNNEKRALKLPQEIKLSRWELNPGRNPTPEHWIPRYAIYHCANSQQQLSHCIRAVRVSVRWTSD